MKTFEQFRRELADAVTVAINTDKRVGCGEDCRCPLGVRTFSRHPITPIAAHVWGLSSNDAGAFISGFDGMPRWSSDDQRFYDLGKLYRERFAEER